MTLASKCFTAEQRQQVEQAVAAAESITACEIVPVIATCSDRYDRAEDTVGLWLAAFSAACVWLYFPLDKSETGSWENTPTWIGVVVMVLVITLAFVIGAFLANKLHRLKRLFIPQKQMINEVEDRARQIFFDRRVHHTEGASGLLLYLSLFESRAVVLGDQLVMTKLGQPFLDHTCQQLTDGLRHGNPADAICKTIEEASSQLSEAIPRSADDVNELHDALVLID